MTAKPIEYDRTKYCIDPLYIVALIAPFSFWVRLSPFSNNFRLEIIGILWSYVQWSDSGGTGSGILFSDTLMVLVEFLMSGFRFVFIMVVRKHQKGLVRRRTVWISAVISQMPAMVFLFSPFFMSGMGGPIPILLIVGLIIDRKIGVEPPSVPWDSESTDTTDEWLSETDHP